MSSCNLKQTFTVESKHEAYYTGGNIEWSSDGADFYCQNGGKLNILSVETGIVRACLGKPVDREEEEDTINSFTVSSDNEHVISHHKSNLFKMWSTKDTKLIKLWKAIHKGPVPQIALLGINLIMASGGSDSSVRLWDLCHNSCTHNLMNAHGVISVLKFHPDEKKELIFAAGDNTKIFAWNTKSGEMKLSLAGHFSKVTSLSFHSDGKHLISSGRDNVLILWDIIKGTSIRTVPTYEGIEGTFILPVNTNCPIVFDTDNCEAIIVASAGEKGIVKLWEMKSGRLLYTQENSLVPPANEEGGLSISHLIFNEQLKSFAVVSADHNIILHSIENFESTKQFVGYSDDILDVVYVGENGSHLALATNSMDIKLYELSTMSCQLLCGHTDLVLSLATSPTNCKLMVSSAKDNSVRVWLMKKSKKMVCIGCGTRHTGSVGSVAFSQASSSFFVSVSQDSCLKLWPLPEKLSTKNGDIQLDAAHTVLAHQKDINSVTVSPNDKLLATGSQDKTAKLWSAESMQLLGVLVGHRRGVWCVRFSPIDQILLTTSADCTLKLWSLTELNCLKTFEGHDSSVLRAEFMSRGMQIVTSGGDGLIKLWMVKTSQCVSTLEEHDSRVLALAVSKDENHIISGGSDSSLIVWRDTTEENHKKAVEERNRMILEEQKLINLLQADEVIGALKLALELGKPYQVLHVFDKIIRLNNSSVPEIVATLEFNHKEKLLECALIWNTNSRNAHIAQLVINGLINEMGSGKLDVASSTIEGLIPYTSRHFQRLTTLLQNLHLLDYTTKKIKLTA